MHVLKTAFAVTVFCAATALAGRAEAAGFYLQEQSVSQQGSAYAGASANPKDASTIFFNPAGLTELKESQVVGGVSVIVPTMGMSNQGSTAGPTGGPFAAYGGGGGGNPFSPTPVPSFYLAHSPNEGRFWYGLGVSSPFGLATEYDAGWFGRYDSTKSELTTINIAPVVAFKVNDSFSIGGGPNIQYAKATLENALPCPPALGGLCVGGSFTTASDGFTRLEGDSWGVGYNFGMLFKLWDTTNIGLHYRSQMNQTVRNGVITIAGLPAAMGVNGTATGEAVLKQPDVASFGVAHRATDKLTLLGSYNWFGWSNFDEIRVRFDSGAPDAVTVQGYDDSYSVAFGAEWKHSDKWTFRGGMQYDQTPTTLPDRSTRTPDSDRYWASIGATFDWDDNVLIDFAASHILMKDGQIGLTKDFYTGSGLDTTVNITGKTDSHIDIFSLQATWRF